MEPLFSVGFFENIKFLFVAILIYAVIYALLEKVKVLGDDGKINSLVALSAAIIVSFTGVITYLISFAINWFVLIFFVVFLLVMLLMFLGIKIEDITSQVSRRPVIIAIVVIFFFLFIAVIIQGFLSLNNAYYDGNDPTIGDEGLIPEKQEKNTFDLEFEGIDRDLLGSVLFLMIIGFFILVIGGPKPLT